MDIAGQAAILEGGTMCELARHSGKSFDEKARYRSMSPVKFSSFFPVRICFLFAQVSSLVYCLIT